jgi:c-di-GMP-binding flagellar brake protein YcgR
LVKHKCLFSVRFGGGKANYLTAILDIDEENKSIIFDCAPKEALNELLLKSKKITFDASFAGIKSSFKGDNVQQIIYKGEPAFAMPLPESIFWMQRREYFRITSPRSKASYCMLTVEGQKPIKLLLYDICLTGFSVLNSSIEISKIMPIGAEFEQGRLVLSGTGEDTISFKVRTKIIINPDKIAALKIQKIGCIFTKITPIFESAVQRYINQLQRESIQKKNEGS